jgi:hypothetical protein
MRCNWWRDPEIRLFFSLKEGGIKEHQSVIGLVFHIWDVEKRNFPSQPKSSINTPLERNSHEQRPQG